MKFFTTFNFAIGKWLFLVLLFYANISIAQTWTGSIDSDWATAGNWNTGTVPDATTDVTIGSTANDPIIGSTTSANALSITITNATLTVDGTLDIANSADDGIGILSGSTVVINGTTTISNTVDDGIAINSNSSLEVNGILTINDAQDDGIDIANGTSTTKNGGRLNINSAAQFAIEIENDTFSIEAGGTVIISGNDITVDGILAFDGADLIEINGDLEIRDLTGDAIDHNSPDTKLLIGSTGRLIIENALGNGFENVVGTNNGLVEMNNLGDFGMQIRPDSTFLNNGTFTITNCALDGVQGGGIFTNTNTVTISDCDGFVLDNTEFNNLANAILIADGSISATTITTFSSGSMLAPSNSPACLSFEQSENLAGVILEMEIDGSTV